MTPFLMLEEIVFPREAFRMAFARSDGTAVCLRSMDFAGMSVEATFITESRVSAARDGAGIRFPVLVFVFPENISSKSFHHSSNRRYKL